MEERHFVDGELLPVHIRALAGREGLSFGEDRPEIYRRGQRCKVPNCGHILSEHNPYDVCWECFKAELNYLYARDYKDARTKIAEEVFRDVEQQPLHHNLMARAIRSLGVKLRKPLPRPKEYWAIQKKLKGTVDPHEWAWGDLAHPATT